MAVLKKGEYGGFVASIKKYPALSNLKVGDKLIGIYYGNYITKADIEDNKFKVKVSLVEVEVKKLTDVYIVVDIVNASDIQEIEITGLFASSYKGIPDSFSFIQKYGVAPEGTIKFDYRDRGTLAYANVEPEDLWKELVSYGSLNGKIIILMDMS